METREKRFNAVRMMRERREMLSKELKDMSFDEQRQFIRDRLRVPDRGESMERAAER